jgi:type VI secretion system protein ImpL
MTRAIVDIVKSLYGLAGLGAALALAILAWLFGPLIGAADIYPFEGVFGRTLLALLPVIAFVAAVAFLGWRRDRRDVALVDAVADETAEAVAAEGAALAGKLKDALAKLKSATGREGNHLYRLPWYVIIGPPGSGKTTAIRQSGLQFPLAADSAISGVGGTRNCDWWLSPDAVLIDTAGRYTTQDSAAAADKAGWENFLGMLRRFRPRQPLNGILVCFGVDMLDGLDAAGRDLHARTVRRRIREIEERLGQRLPVYLLVSKADLVAGFVEFFEDLDRDTRAQVWGMTFPVEASAEGVAGLFAPEFAKLLQRLHDGLLERLQSERGAAQRAAIASFPGQFASIGEPVGAFVAAAFGGSSMDPAPQLRGVYFTSGTQEGTPIDRLTAAMTRRNAVAARQAAQVAGAKGRSYFLGRLMRDVVFNEARLGALDPRRARLMLIARIGCWVAIGAVAIAATAAIWTGRSREAERATILEAAISRAEGAARTVVFDPVRETDFTRILPYLDAARPLPVSATAGDDAWFGLSQSEALRAGAAAAYRRVLERTLLPQLLARLETQMRSNFQKPEFLYEASRVYLMLGRLGPIDAGLVRAWMREDWLRSFPGAARQPVRDALLDHLDALLTGDFTAYPLDGELVDAARRVFARVPMAVRVYGRLRQGAPDLPPWTPAGALGPAGPRLFGRVSGRPLAEGVPGLFTIDGLYNVIMPRLGAAVRDAASESWVMGPEAARDGAADPVRLEADILALYAADYIAAWQGLFDDLILTVPADLRATAEGLNLLGAPNSPLRDLLRAIARQLSLAIPPEGWQPPGRATLDAQRVQQAQGQGPAPTGTEAAARIVDARYRALREAAGPQLDAALQVVNDLYVAVARAAAVPAGAAPPPMAPGLDPAQRLQAEAARLPDPVARWLRTLAQRVEAQRSGGSRAAIAGAGAQVLGPACRMLADPRTAPFPFRRDATQELPVDDFLRLFAPSGTLDQFFAQWVRPHVDTTQRPWRPIAVDGGAPVVAAGDAAQFERAQSIRAAFFPLAIPGAGLRFELLPVGMDPAIQKAVLEVDGIRHEWTRTQARPIPLSWPSRGGVTLTLEPPSPAGPMLLDGPWSAFRLVAGRQAALQATAQPDRLRVTIAHGGASLAFELRTGSATHPFGLRDLQDFVCPRLGQ